MDNLLLLLVPFHRYIFSFCPGRREVRDFLVLFLIFVLPFTPRRQLWGPQELDGKKDPGGLYDILETSSLTSSSKTWKNHETFWFFPSTSFCSIIGQEHQERWKNLAGKLSMVLALALERVNKKSEGEGIEPADGWKFQQWELNHQMLKHHRAILIFLKKTESMDFGPIETVKWDVGFFHLQSF